MQEGTGRSACTLTVPAQTQGAPQLPLPPDKSLKVTHSHVFPQYISPGFPWPRHVVSWKPQERAR